MKEIKVFMKVERTTKRKYRFYESDSSGVAIPYGERLLGTLYLDQSLFSSQPTIIEIDLSISVVPPLVS